MEGSIQIQKYGITENFAPKNIEIMHISYPKNMGDNFHRKMGQHEQFPV